MLYPLPPSGLPTSGSGEVSSQQPLFQPSFQPSSQPSLQPSQTTNAVRPQAPTPGNARLEAAAHQFEASLMQELFKPLEDGSLFGGTGGGGTGDGDSGDGEPGDSGSSNALAQYGAESLARALSERGGFGIARRIIEHLEHRPGGGAGQSRPAAAAGGVDAPGMRR